MGYFGHVRNCSLLEECNDLSIRSYNQNRFHWRFFSSLDVPEKHISDDFCMRSSINYEYYTQIIYLTSKLSTYVTIEMIWILSAVYSNWQITNRTHSLTGNSLTKESKSVCIRLSPPSGPKSLKSHGFKSLNWPKLICADILLTIHFKNWRSFWSETSPVRRLSTLSKIGSCLLPNGAASSG